MKWNKKNAIKRKEFLHQSAGGLAGIIIAGYSPLVITEKVLAAEKVEFRTLGRTNLKVTAVG